MRRQIGRIMKNKLSEQNRLFNNISSRLKHPARKLTELTQQLDDLELRLSTALKHRVKYKQTDLQQLKTRLSHLNPADRLSEHLQTLDYLRKSLYSNTKHLLESKSLELEIAASSLHLVSPLATLDRGYAIVSSRNNNCIVRSYNDVKPRDEIEVKLANGQINCTVNQTKKT